ncbi:class I SAM-dependent methyltransferase [Streptomyces sp. NPDC005813]|uniref:class I SAM-dependent methyltransferase n=1 Tax=Streptomyces sp. NPDC005813 TaxID=3155592 RepID=UPI0033BFC7B2
MTTIANSVQATAWNGPVGAHWAAHPERYDTMVSGVNDALFAGADIAPGDRVLDVGCGAGATTRIAARLAATGHAVGVDISAPLLARAREITAVEGVPNAAYELADAQVHPFPPAGYDVLISRGGVMFFADHAAAFRNLARALRPGGRLAFVCPRPAGPDVEESRALGLFAGLLEGAARAAGQRSGARGGPGPAAEGGARTGTDTAPAPEDRRTRAAAQSAHAAMTAMASLSDPARIREALSVYEDVSVTPVDTETVWGRDAPDAVRFLLSRTPDQPIAPDVRAALEDTLRPYETARGVRLRAAVWLVTGRRSARRSV